MKRIVEEKLKNGTIRYRVETNRCFLGLIPCSWHSCSKYLGMGDCRVDAVFFKLEDAMMFAGIDPNPVVGRKVLEYNNNTSDGHPVKDGDIVRYSLETRRVNDKER